MNDGAMVLDLNALLVELLAAVVPVASEDVTFGTEPAYFFCQPGEEALVYSYKASKQIVGVFVERRSIFLPVCL